MSLVTHKFGGREEMHEWKRFFNHIPGNLNHICYRIFEPDSKAEILHWFNRKDILTAQKDEFIKALIDFDDGCEDFNQGLYLGFYKYRAYFLAAEALAYFPDSCFADVIVEQLLKWSYVYFGWKIVPQPLQKAAREALKITDKEPVILAFTTLLHTTTSRVTLRHAAVELGKLDVGNKTAVAALILLLEVTKNQYTKAKIYQSLGKIGSENLNAIAKLTEGIASISEAIETLPNRECESFLSWCEDCEYHSYRDWYRNYENAKFYCVEVEALGKIGFGNHNAITTLEKFLNFHKKDDSACFDAARALWQINPGNVTAINSLLQIIATTEYSFMLAKSADYLLQISPGNSDVIAILSQRLETTNPNHIRWEAAFYLEKFSSGNITAINTLMQLITSNVDFSYLVYLLQTNSNEQKVLSDIYKCIENWKDESALYRIICKLLRFESHKYNNIALKMLIGFIETATHKTYCSHALSTLGEAIFKNSLDAKMHQEIIATITQFLIKNRGDDICLKAAETLIYLEPDNEIAIATCVEAININRNQYVREQAAVNLLRANHHCNLAIEMFLEPIYQGNIDGFDRNFFCRQFNFSVINFKYHENLIAAFKNYNLSKLVAALKPYLSNKYYHDVDFPYHIIYNLIWNCAQNMTYLDFYRAWHS